MAVPPSGILDIIIIIFYSPALLFGIYAGLKHGFAKSAGWYNLILLCLFRLVGSALGLAAIYQSNQSVYTASLVFSSIGTVTLLGALLGLSGRVSDSLKEKALFPKVARYVQILTIVAIVLAIVGSQDAFSADPEKRATGHTYSKVSAILLIVIFAIAAFNCFYMLMMRQAVPQCERRLLLVCIVALPFIFVRLILAICGAFLYNHDTFSMISVSVSTIVVRAIMGFLMEFVVVALFIWAGCTVDRSAAREAERAEKYAANGIYQGEHGSVQSDFYPKQSVGRV